MAQDGLDMNTFYSILNNIFGRELNENYRSGNRSNWAGAMADLRNGWATMQNNRLNRKRKLQYAMDDGDNTNTNKSIGADANGVYGVGQPAVSATGIGANADGVYGIGQSTPNVSVGVSAIQPKSDNNFSSIFSGNSFNGGSLVNPPMPSVSSSSDSLAQGIGGNANARDLSRYIGNEYNRANWMAADAQRGVTDPVISMLRYQAKIAPLVLAAREDDMRNAFMTYNSENATPEQKADAIAKLAYYTKTPDLVDRIQRGYDNDMYKQGYVRDNSDVGRNILSAFKDYEEGEQWMSPDGTGDSRTQCSNFVSDVLRKVGLNIGSPNGDELMKQFGKAYHTGLDGIQAGDVLNFKNHVGFYVGNGQYIARNSSGGVHQGSMEEAIKAFGQPLGYASVREYAAGKPRYKKDTSKESLLRQKHQYDMEKIAAQNAYRQGRSVRGNANNATVLSDRAVEEANAAFSAYNEYINKEDIDDNIKSLAREKTVLRLYGLYKALTDEDNGGMSPQKARSELRKLGESQKLAPHLITSILDDVESYGKNSEEGDGKDKKSGKTVGEEAADARLNGKKGKSLLETLDTFYDPDLEPTGSGYNISGQSLDDLLGDSLRAINNQRQLVEDTIKNGGYVDIFGNPISKEELARQTREIRERLGY